MSIPANPYRLLLGRLLAVPETRQYLLSRKRRGYMTGKRLACGCFFGTVAPPRARNPHNEVTYAYEAQYSASAFTAWITSLLGEASSGIVAELEPINDDYAPHENGPDTCAQRFTHMVGVLEAKATTWDQQMRGETDAPQ